MQTYTPLRVTAFHRIQSSMSDSTGQPSSTFVLGSNTANPLTIRRLGYGTMRLVGEGAWGEPPMGRDAAIALLRRAVDLGINLLDTADAYGPHIAEDLIADALHPYPKDLVIATKGGLTRTGPAKAKPLGRPEYLIQSVEMSLRRLRLDHIPLYQLHRIDPTVPLAETLGALSDLQKNGKILHIGLSEVTPDQIREAQQITPIASVQNKYSLAEQKSEPTLRFCTKNHLAFLPWYPLNAGKSNTALTAPSHAVGEFARENNLTLSQLALAWLLHRSPVLCPIPGTGSTTHLEENLRSAEVELSDDAWDRFDLILDTQSS